MIRSTGLVIGLFAMVFLAMVLPAQDAAVRSPQSPAASSRPAPTVEELIAQMRAAARPRRSIQAEMTTRASYPGGLEMRIEVALRVLGETHLHIVNQATFDEIVELESETVRTPAGVWRRERDPAFGEVYWTMGPELVARIEAARKAAGAAAEGGFTLDNPISELRGADMLEALAERFDLQVRAATIDGVDYWVVEGERKAAAPTDPNVPTPDRIELLVRASDLIVTSQTHFLRGDELMHVEIEEIVLDAPLEESSFAIALPPGEEWIDVRDFAPVWAQIQQLLRQADAAQAVTESGGSETGATPAQPPPESSSESEPR